MKICAVICEYNPLHSGHLYQLNAIPATFDKKLCIMSGNFVQRAEPAIANKYIRALSALRCGADMVMENPILYAVANGEKFACGAIKTLENIPYVKGLAMGCETDDPQLLRVISDIQLEENSLFKDILTGALEQGQSYASAYCNATATCAEQAGNNKSEIIDILQKPNNLLCIEYIKCLKKSNLTSIEPILIKRKGNSYNNLAPYGDYLSATAIRAMLLSGKQTQTLPFLPDHEELIENCLSGKLADYDLYDKISLYNLLNTTEEQISDLYDCREGLQFKLKKSVKNCSTLKELLENTKSKRYTYARLRRIVLQLNLGITKSVMENANTSDLPFHVLAIKNDILPFLGEIQNAIVRHSDYSKYPQHSYLFEIEKKADALHALLCKTPCCDYNDKLITDKLI